MRLYRGIAPDGSPILFWGDGGDLLAKAAEAFGGDPLGTPAADTMARPIAEAEVTLRGLLSGEDVLVKAAAPESPPPAAPEPPARTVPQAVRDFNSNMLDRGLLLFAKAAEADDPDEEEEGLALGVVMYPNDGEDGAPLDPDTQKDIFSKRAVRDAAYYWMANGGAVDLMHSFEALAKGEEVVVVASDVTHGPVTLGEGDNAFECPEGTWLLTTKWPTDGDLWKGIKAGKFKAYSPGGLATRVVEE